MNLIDIIIIVIMIPMVIRGISKGFVSQAVSFIALFVGSYFAYLVTLKAGTALAGAFGISPNAGNVIVFALALLAVWALLAVLGSLLKKLIQLVLLEWLDKLLGAAFALATTLLLCGLLAIMFDALNETTFIVDRQYLDDSFFYGKVQQLAAIAFPYLHKIIPAAGEILVGATPL